MAHLRTMTNDPDILFKHAANYASRLSAAGPEGMHVYVAVLDEVEEDEMAPGAGSDEAAEGAEGEEPAAAAAAVEGEGDGENDEGHGRGGARFDYSDKFFRYAAAAGKRGSCEWIVGRTLPRGANQGVSYALVDAPEAGGKARPWIDISNVMLHVVDGGAAGAEGAEGTEGSRGSGAVHYLKGFPRVGAYFTAPIVLATVGWGHARASQVIPRNSDLLHMFQAV